MTTPPLRILRLCPVVAARTWGRVARIDEWLRLVHARTTATPAFTAWLVPSGRWRVPRRRRGLAAGAAVARRAGGNRLLHGARRLCCAAGRPRPPARRAGGGWLRRRP